MLLGSKVIDVEENETLCKPGPIWLQTWACKHNPLHGPLSISSLCMDGLNHPRGSNLRAVHTFKVNHISQGGTF